MNYGKILSRAWEITWRWKILWILGFLAALGRGTGGTSNSGYQFDSSDWPWNQYSYQASQVPGEVWAAIVGIGCLAFLLGIAIWVVSVIARGGLIAGVQQVEDEGTTGFGSAWRVGVSRFWTIFGISVLASLPMIILVVLGIVVGALLIGGTVFAVDRAAEIGGALGGISLALCGGGFCCGLVILAVVLGQIRIYAERAAVLEGLGWIDAFKRGWDVLKNNLGPTIVFWLLFLALAIIFGVIIFSVVIVIALPFIAIVTNTDFRPWMMVPVCGGGLLAILVGAAINAIVETFTSATWTLAYRELAGLSAPPLEAPAE